MNHAAIVVNRQAIVVSYHGPTNTRGSCYVAKCQARPRGVRVPYDHALNPEQMAERACSALVSAMGWDDPRDGDPLVWVGGGALDGVTVFVPVPRALLVADLAAQVASAPKVGTTVHVRFGSTSRSMPCLIACVDLAATGGPRICLVIPGGSGWYPWRGYGVSVSAERPTGASATFYESPVGAQ